jgi:hypothetical protein
MVRTSFRPPGLVVRFRPESVRSHGNKKRIMAESSQGESVCDIMKKAIGSGAQTCRPIDVRPVRKLLGSMASPAAFFGFRTCRIERTAPTCGRVCEPRPNYLPLLILLSNAKSNATTSNLFSSLSRFAQKSQPRRHLGPVRTDRAFHSARKELTARAALFRTRKTK